ncbi:S-methyl-5-thioribose-1-phosphate isomerase [Candidatus Magnetomonas plexicatena]|uniref:S-methyl-5-thioribose-1-phosphate isomerase n=1 Tax=Candidatus Magnetomonas plexicatena TaxID=2552947 RepID=UPI001C748590|nr:S-methyl-5-thioribose-1-phosphate isomerase [Nitrospirales bacterium LBB_01]
MVETIRWERDCVEILDQRVLPQVVTYIKCDHYKLVVECIKNLSIRGAPAIGIAASMAVALAASSIEADTAAELTSKLAPVFKDLLDSRPTAVNIRWAVERATKLLTDNQSLPVKDVKELLIKDSISVLKEDIEINKAIGRWGAEFIKTGSRILTHCNAGSLATGGYGTATAPMRTAKEQGKQISVIADETRPVLQGARLTAWELMQDNIDVTLITDNTAGAIMKRGEIDLCIVGTDRTVRNGDVANKIGTYSVAVLAKENNIPFYVAAPLSSIDFTLATGDSIPIEERAADEVTNVFGKCKIAPEGVKVRNIAFDVTPARYITAIITEKGAFRPEDLHHLADAGFDCEKIRIKKP